MSRIFIVYASVDGHTRTICERLRNVVQDDGHEVTLLPIESADGVELSAFDKIVVGASIRYGRHNRAIRDHVDAHAGALDLKPNAFFSVNIVARKAAKARPQTNPYLQKFLRQSRWRPKEVEVFAGRLDYPRYGFLDRLMIRFIMWMTDGPTDPATVVETTDWARVEDFAQRIARM